MINKQIKEYIAQQLLQGATEEEIKNYLLANGWQEKDVDEAFAFIKLLDYVSQQLLQGVSEEEIKNSLLANGWQEKDVDEAFAFFQNNKIPVPPPSQPLTSLPNPIMILDQAGSIYNQRVRKFVGIMVIPILITIAVFFIIFSFSKFLDILLGPSIFVIIFIIVLLIFLITQAWGQTALLYAIKDSQQGIGIIESYRRAWHNNKIISYIWMSFLQSLIILTGFLFLIVPGVVFSVWFILAPFILITENLKGINALLKSREYVKGKWFAVFWRLFFLSFLLFIIELIPTIVVGSLNIPFGEVIIQSLLFIFLVPLNMIYIFLLYNYLKDLKGEIVFEPTKKEKTKFIILGIIGLLFIPIIIFSIISLIRSQEITQEIKITNDILRTSDITMIRSALDFYYYDHNSYPSSLNELIPNYLEKLPVDPLTKQLYQYQLKEDGNDYELCVNFEYKKTKKCFSALSSTLHDEDIN